MEDNARGKAILQTERDEALCRARRNTKQTERTSHQLMEVKTQLADVKAQLADATDYKVGEWRKARWHLLDFCLFSDHRVGKGEED